MSQKKKHANTWNIYIYIYIYIFFLLTKRKNGKKNGLIRDKVWIENVEMRVIKWESWNDNREEKNERERERCYLFQLWVELLKRAKLLRL